MTKKAERAARIEAAKILAYHKKVATLVGYVGPRITSAMISAAMLAEKTAEAYAAELAALEPVGKAVFPIKLEAVKDATDWANKRIAYLTAKLEAGNWDIDVVAPRPRYDDADYKVKAARRQEFSSITKVVSSSDRPYETKPTIVAISEEGVARFIANAERNAAFNYDAFACKLVAKVGPCDSAELDNANYVWSNSILSVKKGAIVERWHTQQITNVSVLGTYFPQWPTRLLKAGK